MGEEGVQKSEHQEKRDNSPALRSQEICLAKFLTWLGLKAPPSLPISPCRNGNVSYVGLASQAHS